ncbi:MAG: ribosome-binding factor A [Xanthomonadales bacterium]|nr:ribosome-binding factor A [Xanthomonadales bacterium]
MPRETPRSSRVGSRIQRVLGQVISADIRDSRLGLSTVTDVEVTKDLSAARVYISALGDREAAGQAVEVLNERAPYLRHRVAQAMSLRHTPSLRFMPDYSQADSDRIRSLLNSGPAGEADNKE